MVTYTIHHLKEICTLHPTDPYGFVADKQVLKIIRGCRIQVANEFVISGENKRHE